MAIRNFLLLSFAFLSAHSALAMTIDGFFDLVESEQPVYAYGEGAERLEVHFTGVNRRNGFIYANHSPWKRGSMYDASEGEGIGTIVTGYDGTWRIEFENDDYGSAVYLRLVHGPDGKFRVCKGYHGEVDDKPLSLQVREVAEPAIHYAEYDIPPSYDSK